jgi:threonine dehydratase
VVSYSSGNFGIAVAFGGWNLGIPVTIVVPQDAPAAKLHKIRLMGAKIVLADRTSDNRIQLARDLAQQTGAVLLPFADQPQVIAGAGTVVLEMLEQLRAQSLDTVLVPCGGGSLTAGSALVLQSLSPKTRVIAVEPVGLDDTARSLAAGKILANDPAARSICDSLLTRQPSPLTFAMLQAGQAANQLACMAVEDIAVQHAVVWLAKRLHQVVEPGGAIALAALLSQPQNFVGQRVGVLLTGANG